MRPLKRQGFTLYQLLLIMALFAILLGFLLPAIAKVRMAAARMASQNNLKQIALAVHNHEAANRFMPSGNDANNFSAAAHLLPYIEQNNIYNMIDFKQASDAKANAELRALRLKIFMSPLDTPHGPKEKEGPTNYFFSAGTQASLTNNNGMFYQNSKMQFAGITDGTSNTLMTVESLKGAPKGNSLTVMRQHIGLDAKALNGLKENAGVADFKQGKNILADRGASWMDGRFLQTTINGGLKPNDERPDISCAGQGGWSAPRTMGETFQVGMGDGSVRSIHVSIAPKVLMAAFTRNGGEVVTLD